MEFYGNRKTRVVIAILITAIFLVGTFTIPILITPPEYGSDIVGCWSFDELDTDFKDLCGETPPATNYDATWGAEGQFGRAVDFERHEDDNVSGTTWNQYVDLNFGMGVSGESTITAWIKPESFEAMGAVVGQTSPRGAGDADSISMLFNRNDSHTLSCRYAGLGEQENEEIQSSRIMREDEWYFVACVYNGTGGFVEVNGVRDYRPDVPRPFSGTNDNFSVGRWGEYFLGFRFDGVVDEVKIWNRSLSYEELDNVRLYNSVTKSQKQTLSEHFLTWIGMLFQKEDIRETEKSPLSLPVTYHDELPTFNVEVIGGSGNNLILMHGAPTTDNCSSSNATAYLDDFEVVLNIQTKQFEGYCVEQKKNSGWSAMAAGLPEGNYSFKVIFDNATIFKEQVIIPTILSIGETATWYQEITTASRTNSRKDVYHLKASVTGVKKRNTFGHLANPAKEGNTYLIVEITLENTGNTTVSEIGGGFLSDAQGRGYLGSSASQTVTPGNTIVYESAFQVSKNATGFTFLYPFGGSPADQYMWMVG